MKNGVAVSMLACALGFVIVLSGSVSAVWDFPRYVSEVIVTQGSKSGALSTLAYIDSSVMTLTKGAQAAAPTSFELSPDRDNGSTNWGLGCVGGGGPEAWSCLLDPLETPDGNSTIDWTTANPAQLKVGHEGGDWATYTPTGVRLGFVARKNSSGTTDFTVRLQDPVTALVCGEEIYTGVITQAFAKYETAMTTDCDGEALNATVVDRLEASFSINLLATNITLTSERLIVNATYIPYSFAAQFNVALPSVYLWPQSLNITCNRTGIGEINIEAHSNVTGGHGSDWWSIIADACPTGAQSSTNTALLQNMSWNLGGKMYFRLSSTDPLYTGFFLMDRFVIGVDDRTPRTAPPDIMGGLGNIIFALIFVAIVITLVILAYIFRKRHGGI